MTREGFWNGCLSSGKPTLPQKHIFSWSKLTKSLEIDQKNQNKLRKSYSIKSIETP